jgi:cell division protease FtsH
MAEALIKYETLDEEQIKDIMKDKEPRPPDGWNIDDESGDDDHPKDSKIGGHATQH